MSDPVSAADPWVYLDVAVSQVQTWISRTPRLRLRRGASFLLAQVTAQRAHTWLPAPWQWNDEAGEISGVIALKRPAAGEPDLRDSCLAIATEVVARLAPQIPYAAISVDWGIGASYVQAHDDMLQRRSTDRLLEPLPLADESIVSRPCGGCGAHAVVDFFDIRDHRTEVCAECMARHRAAGFMTGQEVDEWPTSMQELYGNLVAQPSDPIDSNWFPDDFSQLARLWSTNPQTQLATIYADGNRVGTCLDALIDVTVQALPECDLAEPGAGCPEAAKVAKADLVNAIDTATKSALASAVQTALPGTPDASGSGLGWRPVIVHVAAGDDMIVSVPAEFAWPFLRSLSDTFTALSTAALKSQVVKATAAPAHACLRPFLETTLSLGIGMVFHHLSHPIDDAITRADAEMKTAKGQGRGAVPTVSFLDLTADGERRPTKERVWQLSTPEPGDTLPSVSDPATAGTLQAIADIDTAGRQTLLTLVRDALAQQDNEPTPTGEPGSEMAWQALERRIDAMRRQAIRVIYPARTQPPSSDELHQLRRYLDAARWWHNGTTPDAQPPDGEPEAGQPSPGGN